MNLIVAVSNNYGIGKNNGLLFNLPSDLKYFKAKTLNKVVVMGKKTFLSLPKRPLPNRTSVVLTSDKNFTAQGTIIVHDLNELFAELEKYDSDDVFVCGGAQVYNALMPYCKTAFVTFVNASEPADTHINNLEENGFYIEEQSEVLHENGLDFSFAILRNPMPKSFQKGQNETTFSL